MARSPSWTPHDGSPLRDDLGGDRGRRRPGGDRRPVRPAGVGATPAAERGARLLALADAIEAPCRRAGPARDLRYRPPAARHRAASTCRGQRRASAISVAWPTSTGKRRAGRAWHVQLRPAPARGRGGCHRAVELSPYVHELEARPTPRRGQHLFIKPSELTPLPRSAWSEPWSRSACRQVVVTSSPARAGAPGRASPDIPTSPRWTFTGVDGDAAASSPRAQGNLTSAFSSSSAAKGANLVFEAPDSSWVQGRLRHRSMAQACTPWCRLLWHECGVSRGVPGPLREPGQRSIRIGDPTSRGTELGPLTSAAHQERVLSY